MTPGNLVIYTIGVMENTPAESLNPKDFKLTEVEGQQNLGDKKEHIAATIERISRPLFEKPPKVIQEGEDKDAEADEEDDEFDEEDDEVMSGIEQKMASDIKKALDTELGGNWNILVGNRFSSLVNLLAKDRHGSFKYGPVHIDVFEANNY